MISFWQLVLLSQKAAECLGSSSGGRGRFIDDGQPPAPDIPTRSKLFQLYSQPVMKMTHVERPLENGCSSRSLNEPVTGISKVLSKIPGPLKHSGVVVDTPDGSRYLIHKGENFGKSSQTVVTDARHMSSKWKEVESKEVSGSTVGDFVRVGGEAYNIFTDNCHLGRRRMMELK